MSERPAASACTPLAALVPDCAYVGEIAAPFATTEFARWLVGLPGTFAARDADLVYRLRNKIYRIADPAAPAGPGFCVKSFKAPPLLRSLAYRRIGSKAARSHRFALHLRAHGAGTTEPVAYFERWSGPRLVESYLVTRFLENGTDLYSEMSRLLREDPDAAKYIALLRFAADAIRRMHDSGYVHNDLGGQNLMLRRTGDAAWADPCFIDLNRGDLCASLTLRQRARDLAKLEFPSHFRRIFFRIYFGDGPIPRAFARWENLQRLRITWHNESRKYRHPIRHLLRHRNKIVSTGRPAYRDTWLWDAKSGQPSVVLESRDRRRERPTADLFRVAWHNLLRGPKIWSRYRALLREAYAQPVDLTRRLGVAVETGPHFTAQLALLAETPGLPVFVRCYFHQGSAGLDACADAVAQLAARGHEVALGLIQSRRSVLAPDEWQAFCAEALRRMHAHVRFVEVAHAVNRVKWGTWGLRETVALWDSVAALRAQYPAVKILGPAVNDFEYHYYPPLLAKLAGQIDGLSNHLYVDRRGAPENFQGKFSLLEKCALGRAVAEAHGIKGGFYVSETNWPLRGTGEYSPLAGAYTPRDYVESPLHVDEATAAAYLIRYALIALCSGMTERVWWWNLTTHGFGLADELAACRPRPAWRALVHFHRTVGTSTFRSREQRDGARWFHFDHATVVYALAPTTITLPADVTAVHDLEGHALPVRPGEPLKLEGQPVYLSR
ncbi:MAG TPA: lipopolysaccharide kinase InaA family protein [Opitutaceae bacterium]|nr:lipopolysaccharide kinase InaA family protein [Opitutaceae bacterium]